MNDAWRRVSTWYWEKAFKADDRWQQSRQHALDLLEHLMEENDLPSTLDPDGAEDHYHDEDPLHNGGLEDLM